MPDPDPAVAADTEQMLGWIEQIVAQGVRRPGYPADLWAESWCAERFDSFGLEGVSLEPVPLPLWEPLDEGFEVWPTGAADRSVRLPGFILPHSAPAPDGIEADLAPLAWSDAAMDPVGTRRAVAGKLAVCELDLLQLPQAVLRDGATYCYDPDGDFDTEVQTLPFGAAFMHVMEPSIDAGAVGFIGALGGMPWETCKYYVPYDALARPIPGLWISPDSSARLRSLMEEGPTRGRLCTSSERREVTSHNVLATLPGASDDWVIIASHHDAPWASAVEDASGMALVLGQALYWSRVPHRLRPHNLLFLLTSGHMTGGAGTRSFIAAHRELLPRVVVEIHLEHVARRCIPVDGRLEPTDAPEPRWWFTSQHPELEALVGSAIRDEDLRRSFVLRPDTFSPDPPTDGAFFHPEGVPIVQFLTAPMYLFDAADTLDKIHAPSLEPLTRAVARIVHGTSGATSPTFRSEPAAAPADGPIRPDR